MDPRSRRIPSTVFDDGASIRSRAYHNSGHLLRHAESRYSLQEQFAATRREYEFGFDDASSVLERSTLASEAIRPDDLDDGVVDGEEPPTWFEGSTVNRTCYELLCLPMGPSLSPDQVRDAANRLVRVLAVDKQPPRLQKPAAFYLGLTQAAFEILVEPSKRLGYDLSGVDELNPDSDQVVIDDFPGSLQSYGSYEGRLQEQYLLLTQRDSRAATELGFRMSAAPLLTSQRVSRRHGSGLEILDFSLRKTATTALPALREPVEGVAIFIQGLTGKRTSKAEASHPVRVPDPTVTIIGATHGLLDEPFKLAPLLVDRYQPPGPSIHGRRRMEQLLASRFLPLLSLNFRQDFSWREDPAIQTKPDFIIEQELEVLPHFSTTTRVGHSVKLFGSEEPLSFEVSARKLLTRSLGLSPDLGLAVHQRVGSGTAFLVADGGNRSLGTSKECREVSQFSKVSGKLVPLIDAFHNPPTVEVGYAFGRHDLGLQSGQALTKPTERGLAALDSDIDECKPSSWTISTGFTPGNVAAYLRYGRDLLAPPTRSKFHSKSRASFRAEAELAGTAQRDFFLAFRALKRVGRFSKVGLEVGFSPSNLHLSLYWSRLSQRISLPFLVANTTTARSWFATKVLFWTAVFPFAALAAWELYRQRQRASKAPTNITTTVLSKEKEKKLQSYIARSRAEADELTVLLATGVEPRQAVRRRRGGLVIVSAKYGARDAPSEESRLPGFWDPAPLADADDKVLRVKYLWRGKEHTVEVQGREELRLP
ncbi:hypothetical protein C7999DRAFT_11458 [Corynascus novoguineensis]|uniref:J domain-containing protein n=1 Tax=Corynascus novoguineensis TaxID=1126955 RepID=A0AAN7CYV4_9PEZI|nr:hypothetical protein C7999DRAFT_11458 [Corynascus novoguineensis]